MARPSFPKHNLYKILGVDSKASLDDIKKAYRDLCLKVHPDKAEGGSTPENNDRFAKVQEAWEILRDEVLRPDYDEFRANGYKDTGNRDKHSKRHRHRKQHPGSYTGDNKPHRDDSPEGDQYHAPGESSYAPKPNRPKEPYFEEWGPGPAPNDHYKWRDHQPDPRRNASPPRSIKLEDRIIAMRIRSALKPIYIDIDFLQTDLDSLSDNFQQHVHLPRREMVKWGNRFDYAQLAINLAEDLYIEICILLEEVESGHSASPYVSELPDQLGALQAQVTRMRMASIGANIVFEQLTRCPPHDNEWRQLMEDFSEKLHVWAMPAYKRSRPKA